jgi:phenylacetate-CoA ligase
MEAGAHAHGVHRVPGRRRADRAAAAAIADLRPAGYAGTPSFLRILVEKALETGSPSLLRKALVSGEAFPPSLRDWFGARAGRLPELRHRRPRPHRLRDQRPRGPGARRRRARRDRAARHRRPGARRRGRRGGGHHLHPDYPLVRFGTGDLSAVLPGTCPTGRTNTRIKGWLGRADQTTKIRGMFVHPGQVADIARRFPEVVKARLVVSGEMANDR